MVHPALSCRHRLRSNIQSRLRRKTGLPPGYAHTLRNAHSSACNSFANSGPMADQKTRRRRLQYRNGPHRFDCFAKSNCCRKHCGSILCLPQFSEISESERGHVQTVGKAPKGSAAEGQADEIRSKADIRVSASAYCRKAVAFRRGLACVLLARSSLLEKAN